MQNMMTNPYMPIQAQEEPKKNRKKLILLIIGVAAALSIAVYGITAYLTDTKTLTNEFTLDTDFSIALAEPNWVAADAQDLAPAATIAKDPTVTNTSAKMDAWVAMTVKVPVFDGSVAGADGTSTDVSGEDLYAFAPNVGWTLVSTSDVENGYRTYAYVHDAKLAKGASATLFDEVTVPNFTTNPTIKAADNQIDVEARAIQATGFDTAADAYAAYVKQQVPAAEAA